MNKVKWGMLFIRFILMAIVVLSFCSQGTAAEYGDRHHYGKTEVWFDEGVHMPNVVRPVIILQGTDYEIGYQYFKQLVQINGKSLPSYQYDVMTTYRRDKIHRDSYSEGEMCALGKFEAAIRAHAPEWIDIFRGMADGARDSGLNITYTDLLYHYSIFERVADWGPKTLYDSVFNNDTDTDCDLWAKLDKDTKLAQGKKDAKSAATCSGFAAWGATTKDGKLIAAGSGDDWEGNFSATIIVFPKTGNNFITEPFNLVGFGGFPNHPSMNNKGVVEPHHGGSSFKGSEKWSFNALPRGIANMHTIRFANSAEDAYNFHMSYSPGVQNLGVGAFYVDVEVGKNDGKTHAFVVESRRPELAIRYPGDNGEGDFIYATNNWFSDNLPRGGTKVEHAGYWYGDSWYWWSVSRNLFMNKMLSENQGKVDEDFCKMMYRYPSRVNEESSLEDIDAAYWDGDGSDYQAAIGSMENATIAIAVPDNGNNGKYYVSTGAVARQTGPAYPGAHQYQPEKTFAWHQLKLAESPKAVAEAARTQAHKDIEAAYEELNKAHLQRKVAHPLKEILWNAQEKFEEGEHCLRDAQHDKKHEGRDAIYDYSKATRCFAAAQAYANQVYEVLVPPATKPDELGLKP